MREIRDIAEHYAESQRAGHSAALATVVRTSGSTYRRPGARMLILETGQVIGCVSGGCLERDVVQRARRAMLTRQPRVVTYDSTADGDEMWGFALGCNGVVDVLIEPLGHEGPDAISFMADCMRTRESGLLATVLTVDGDIKSKTGARLAIRSAGEIATSIDDQRLQSAVLADAEPIADGGPRVVDYQFENGNASVFFEPIRPPLSLIIIGAGHDAVPLVRQAQRLGWFITLVDYRPANLVRARSLSVDRVVTCRPPQLAESVSICLNSAVIVMNHNYVDDLESLATVLRSPARYIGVLGPKLRTEQLLSDMRKRGELHTDAQFERLYGPVGLDIGADNPEEIALSIVAEIQAVFAERSGGSARDRNGPLHRRDETLVAMRSRPGLVRGVACAAGE